MYANVQEYKQICIEQTIPDEELEKALLAAEQDINALTYNRIVGRGFVFLTEYQQGIIKRAVCYQANFNYEYADTITNPIASYGINGVSMSFDNTKVLCMNGVYTLNSIQSLLRQTGLTYRGVR